VKEKNFLILLAPLRSWFVFVHFRKVPEPTEGMRHEMARMLDSIL